MTKLHVHFAPQFVRFASIVALAALTSCASQSPRTPSSSSCVIGQACGENGTCMSAVQGTSCYPSEGEAPINDLVLPFDASTEVICTHASGVGSHSWPNAFYALDLANRYEEPAATVRAAASGKAFVFLGNNGKPCPEPRGTPARADPDTCGLSWGNHVKVLHEGGYVTFYVHLEKVFVKNGEFVKQGQPLGLEGWTGAAGHRHLHFSVQRIPGSNVAEWEKNIAQDGRSVPFHMHARLFGVDSIVKVPGLKCAHAQIGEAPEALQPRLRGVN